MPYTVLLRRSGLAACTLFPAYAARGAESVSSPEQLVTYLDIPLEFFFFTLVLTAIIFFHRHILLIAVSGLLAIISYKLAFTGFSTGFGITGFAGHLVHEWPVLTNLLLLLLGFAILAWHFGQSRLPVLLPRYIPGDWRSPFLLLIITFVLSGFLDNIAAAMIGGTMAAQLFNRKVHIGYLAALVAAANGGGAGSIIGDTTTIMMWTNGATPGQLFKAYIGAIGALCCYGPVASYQQQAYSPAIAPDVTDNKIDLPAIAVVVGTLVFTVGVNILVNIRHPEFSGQFPVFGSALWVGILFSTLFRHPDWTIVSKSIKGSLFLLCLVLMASLMPVNSLPDPEWKTVFLLGLLSSVFDNIPLTALAIQQNNYDWGLLAYAVGFGGSMMWFGSSAGIALTNLFPEGRSALLWVRHGWAVILGYLAGFFLLFGVGGWSPALLP